MSCQQAPRFITTNHININQNSQTSNNNHNILKGNHHIAIGAIQQEDPYVFTETVPTIPPILFNSQKTRPRLNDLTPTTTIEKVQLQKLPLTEANGKIASNSNQIKTQASFLSATIINSTVVPTSKNNIIQCLSETITKTPNNCNTKKKLSNVCIVRPQLQTQQLPHFQHHLQNFVDIPTVYEGDLKSISPPPLYTPPTPSLWQTPLLLETIGPSSAKVNSLSAAKSATTVPIMGCVQPTVHTVGSTKATVNPSLTATVTAKVAPIFVHTQSAPPPQPTSPAQSPNQCLPPSKFHNHTLAQHLQKVECIKKPMKSNEDEAIIPCKENDNSISSPLKSSSSCHVLSKTTDMKQGESATDTNSHSDSEDLNDIPVNVIFRMAMVQQTNEKSSNNIQLVKPQTEFDMQPSAADATPQQQSLNTDPQPSSPNITTQLKTNVNKKLPIPAPKTIVPKQLQQINTSSMPQQKQQTSTTTSTIALNSIEYQKLNENNNAVSEKLKTMITNDSKTVATQLKKKNATHISNKTRKLNAFFSTNFNSDLSCNLQICGTGKGVVAVVKMSQHDIDLDTVHLATATGLPYALQHYWLDWCDFYNSPADMLPKDQSFPSRSLAREERIGLYKQQLRRQAIQLLSTRSLQKLPLTVAKRRLLCVDRLLRKYHRSEKNNKEQPINVKLCCVKGCEAYTLEMTSHCQQHVVYNAAQHVFLPCTAKFADNTQCRIPVFDITHDLPLCMEHARKRDAYNRLLYEQRPRKISTNPIVMNKSNPLAVKFPVNNTIGVGISIKAQNDQQKRQNQQYQNILQQLPQNNNSNGNKQTVLANQQTRKSKMSTGTSANPVGRPQKRVKKSVDKSISTIMATAITKQQMPRLTGLKRKSSTTSLESIASNSQHSNTSSTSQHLQKQSQQHLYGVNTASSLAPPALAPLSSGLMGHSLPKHLFSFGHDSHHYQTSQNQNQLQHHQHPQRQHQQFNPININEKHSSTSSTTATAKVTTPTELKEFISQFSFISQKQTQAETIVSDVNFLNTNSNSNFTSSGMGSTTSLPSADDFITQDMLSICENSSASSADTGLGGLSDPELMFGGPEDDIALGDTQLLEEHDLENVLNSLSADAFKELFSSVHQDESDEIERAIEFADKSLKRLQQTTGSELVDFLDFSDDMLMDNGDICNGSTTNFLLDTSALLVGGGGSVGRSSLSVAANGTQGGGKIIETDTRGLVQT